jgi:lipid A 4'-phosphatase
MNPPPVHLRAADAAPAAAKPLALLRGAVPVWLLTLMAAASLAFLLLPQVDLAVSGWFARGAAGFPLQHDPWLAFVNNNVLKVSRAASALLLLLFVLGFVLPRGSWLGRNRRAIAFLFLALAIGPGLIVNTLLKEHSGRARPVQVEQFGGSKQFTPAFVIADQCERNCSFVSGHVAAATMPVAGYFLASTRRRRRLWLAGGVALGLAVSLVRVVVGAHFLSDVVVAMFITWVACALVAAVMRVRPAPEPAPESREVGT